MSNEIVKFDIEKDIELALAYADKSLAENTKKSYHSQWEIFKLWCLMRGVSSMPATPETCGAFFSAMAKDEKKRSTIERFKYVISKAHSVASERVGNESISNPVKSVFVKETLAGIWREIGSEQDRVDPLSEEAAKKIADLFKTNCQADLRNRVIILVGWLSASRRSELVNIERKNIKITEEGVLIKIARSKTDKEGKGVIKAIRKRDDDYCAVRAIVDWLVFAPESKWLLCHVDDGVMKGTAKPGQQLSDKMIARMISKWCDEIGESGRFAGHSLRAGFVTAAVKAGKSDRSIMRVTGHKTHQMIDVYARIANPFEENASDGLLSEKSKD